MIITAENVSGLVVGEGCFYAESCADPKYLSGWRIRPAFCVEMREDDREVLEAIKHHLQCGRIYELDFGRYKGYGERGWRRHSKFRVTRLEDLHSRVVPFFLEHPLFGRKQQAFELFSQIVVVLRSRRHLAPEGLDLARLLASQLREHNARGLASA